jgi:hypothetical protein
MSVIKITVESADAALSKTSRLIAFPDGTARIITLEQRHWTALDRLHERGIWPADEPATRVLDHVHTCMSDPVQLESQIRYWFKLVIQDAMADVATVGGRAANEPLLSTKPLINLRQVFSRAAVES